ncbi:unnamed protein product [Arctogadus glacialis]
MSSEVRHHDHPRITPCMGSLTPRSVDGVNAAHQHSAKDAICLMVVADRDMFVFIPSCCFGSDQSRHRSAVAHISTLGCVTSSQASWAPGQDFPFFPDGFGSVTEDERVPQLEGISQKPTITRMAFTGVYFLAGGSRLCSEREPVSCSTSCGPQRRLWWCGSPPHASHSVGGQLPQAGPRPQLPRGAGGHSGAAQSLGVGEGLDWGWGRVMVKEEWDTECDEARGGREVGVGQNVPSCSCYGNRTQGIVLQGPHRAPAGRKQDIR